MRLFLALICAAALAAVVPQTAAACAPAVCQYVEQPPSANGHNPGNGHHSNGPSSLSRKTQQKLNSTAAGRAAEKAAGATPPKSQGKKQKGKKANGKKGSGKLPAQQRRTGSALASASTGSGGGGSSSGGGGGGGGIGIVIPLILGLSLLAALAYVLWRRGVFRNFDLGSVFNRRGDVGG
jgi:hypothetical protein